MLISYATEPGFTASDGASTNSPFSRALSELLPVEGLIAEQVFKRVADRVNAATGGAQTPFYNSGLTGEDFCFAGCNGGGGSFSTITTEQRTVFDLAETPCDYAAFVDHYPRSPLAGMARSRSVGCNANGTGSGRSTGAEAVVTAGDDSAVELASPDSIFVPGFGAQLARLAAETGDELDARVFRDCEECPQMIAMPTGSFNMGSPDDEKERKTNEGPQRAVTVPVFAASKFEISWNNWAACQADGGCTNADPREPLRNALWGTGNRPLIHVSWDDARRYVDWLNTQVDGSDPYRLLTEAEWEYAARAGTQTPFNTGETISGDQANYNSERIYGSETKGIYNRMPMPVGAYAPNAFGLYDMHGNVAEWTADCYYPTLSGLPADGSAAPEDDGCNTRSLRGGSWEKIPSYIRSARREGERDTTRADSIGFRVGRDLD